MPPADWWKSAGGGGGGFTLVVVLLLTPTGASGWGSGSLRSHFAGCADLNLRLHGGIGRGIFVCYDQQLVEGFWLIAEKLVLEEGALSASYSEVPNSLHLVHALARVVELGPACELVAS